MGLRTFPCKILVRVWSLVAIRAEMSKQHDQTCPNLSEPVHNSVTMYALRTMPFLHFQMLLFFSILFYPAEIAFFNSPNWQLSNGVQVMEQYWNRNVDPSGSPCLETVDRKSFQHRNFLVLRPVLLKIAYFNSANWQLSNDVWPKELQQRKIVDPSRGAP